MHRWRTLVADGEALAVAPGSVDAAVCRLRDPFQPGSLMSLGKPGLLDGLFGAAGFRDIATTAMNAPFRLPTARHYLEFIRSSASPVQQILGRLEPDAANAAWSEMEERLGIFTTTEGWVGPNELLLTAARR